MRVVYGGSVGESENLESRSNNIACVILAAGKSVRFGGLKQLALIDGKKSLVQRAIDTANASKCDSVFLVLGDRASEIAARVSLGRANLLYNKDFESGLSSSIRCGISNLPPGCNAAILMVADQPFFTTALLNRMIEAYNRGRALGIGIVAMAQEGELRNPVLLDSLYFPELQELEGDSGAKALVEKHISECKMVEADNASVLLDIDTEESLRRVAKDHGATT